MQISSARTSPMANYANSVRPMDKISTAKPIAKDRFEPSPHAARALSNTLTLDKGTASSTTLYVDQKTMSNLMSDALLGGGPWEECGKDDDKEWIVINGQRFERPLSPQEKAERRAAQKTLLDYMEEEEAKRKDEEEKRKRESELTETPIQFDAKGMDALAHSNNPKLQALSQNTVAMEALQKASRGGAVSLWS